jgi:hypothetical protein
MSDQAAQPTDQRQAEIGAAVQHIKAGRAATIQRQLRPTH